MVKTIAMLEIRGKAWRLVEEINPVVDGEEVDGYCCHDTRTICVRASLTGHQRLRVILHEAVHACSEDVSEEFVEAVEHAIVHCLLLMSYDTDAAGDYYA